MLNFGTPIRWRPLARDYGVSLATQICGVWTGLQCQLVLTITRAGLKAEAMITLRRLKATPAVASSSTFQSDNRATSDPLPAPQRQALSVSSTAQTLAGISSLRLAEHVPSSNTSDKGHKPRLTDESQSPFRSLKSRLSRTSSRLGLRKRRTIIQEVPARTSSKLPCAEVQAAFVPGSSLTNNITSPVAAPASSPGTCVPLFKPEHTSSETVRHTFVKMASENSQPVSYSRLQDITISVSKHNSFTRELHG
jgi:hypothetical protein